MDDLDCINSAELRQILKVSQRELRDWLKRGLPHEKTKGRCQFDPLAVRRWLIKERIAEPITVEAAQDATNGKDQNGDAEVCFTKSACAKRLGVSTRAVTAYQQEEGFPGYAGTRSDKPDGYYPIPKIIEWLKQNHPSSPVLASEPTLAAQHQEQWYRARAERAMFELGVAKSTYVDAETVRRFYLRTIGYVTSQLDQLPDRLRGSLPNNLDPAIVDLCGRIATEVTDGLRNAIAELIEGDQDEAEE